MADWSAIMIFLNHLRRNVVGSATQGIPFSIFLNLSCQSKITNLNLEPLGQEQITQLDITMNNIPSMHFLQPMGQLPDIKPRLLFSQELPPSDQLIKGLIDAQLQKQVNVVLGFEGFDETHDVFVGSFAGFGELFVEFDFGAQSFDELLGFVKRGFLYDLEGVVLLCVVALFVDFVASGKTPLR